MASTFVKKVSVYLVIGPLDHRQFTETFVENIRWKKFVKSFCLSSYRSLGPSAIYRNSAVKSFHLTSAGHIYAKVTHQGLKDKCPWHTTFSGGWLAVKSFCLASYRSLGPSAIYRQKYSSVKSFTASRAYIVSKIYRVCVPSGHIRSSHVCPFGTHMLYACPEGTG